MRNPFKAFALCAVLCLCLLSVRAADLETYKEVYQKSSEEIRQKYTPQFADVQQQYQKKLEALKASAVKQGDLPSWEV